MGNKTGIEWTDATWNPVTGCAKVSQGCKNCYALRDWPRMAANPKTVYFGRQFTDVMTHADRLDQPLRWTKPRRIFVNSMSDLFHPAVPDEFINKVFAVMARSRWHTFQVLTKRAERLQHYLSGGDRKARILAASMDMGCAGMMDMPWPLPNVWLGVSVEDQAAADERILLLLQTPATVRWISAEPLLGPVNLAPFMPCSMHLLGCTCGSPAIDWVVAGGESGQNARPMHPTWARGLRDQCKTAAVPFLFKQWGEWAPKPHECNGTQCRFMNHAWADGALSHRIGKKAAGRLLDGALHNDYPMRTE